MDEKEVKEAILKVGKGFEEFKATNDEAIKRNEEKSQEVETKLEKISTEITSEMKTLQEKFCQLQAMANQTVSSPESKSLEFSDEFDAKFREFGKKGGNESFAEFGAKKSENKEFKAMSVLSEENGGFMVTPERLSAEKTRSFETSPMRAISRVVNTSSDSVELPVRDGARVGATWVTETESRATTNTRTIKLLKIEAHEMYSYPLITQKLLDDAGFDASSWIFEDMNEDFEIAANTAFVTGSATDTPQGFMAYDDWTTPGTYQSNAIEQIFSGSGTNFTADGIINLQNALLGAYQANAVFLTKRQNFKNIAKLKDGNGNYLFNRDLDKSIGMPFGLLQKPLMFADDIATVSAGNLALAYGDFRKGYMIVDRIGVRVLRDPYSNKPHVGFYATKRVGGGVYNFEAIKIQDIAAS